MVTKNVSGIEYKMEYTTGTELHNPPQDHQIGRREFLMYGTGGIASLISGCVSPSAFKILQEGNRKLERDVDRLSEEQKLRLNEQNARLERVERRPLYQSSISVLKEKTPYEFGTLSGRIFPLYQDAQSRMEAEINSDIIEIDPTNGRDPGTQEPIYNVFIGHDLNKDGKLTPNIDRIYPDRVGSEIKPRFELRERELIELIKDFLPFVRQYSVR